MDYQSISKRAKGGKRENKTHKPKGTLRMVSAKQQSILLQVKESFGLDHNKSYTVEVSVEGKVLGSGTNSSIKNAEIDVALDALQDPVKLITWIH